MGRKIAWTGFGLAVEVFILSFNPGRVAAIVSLLMFALYLVWTWEGLPDWVARHQADDAFVSLRGALPTEEASTEATTGVLVDSSAATARLAATLRADALGDITPEASSTSSQSSTLAGIQTAGATFIGDDWEIADVKTLVNQTLPLKLLVYLHPNVGSGATPGMWIRCVNREANAVRGVRFVITNMRRWSELSRQFVETPETAQFQGLETASGLELFCEIPVDFGFVRFDVTPTRLAIDGNKRGAGRAEERLTITGKWKLVGQVMAGARVGEYSVCFEWDGKSGPRPCECYQTNFVSKAPPPPLILPLRR